MMAPWTAPSWHRPSLPWFLLQAVAKGRKLRFVGLEHAPKRSLAKRLAAASYVLKGTESG